MAENGTNRMKTTLKAIFPALLGLVLAFNAGAAGNHISTCISNTFVSGTDTLDLGLPAQIVTSEALAEKPLSYSDDGFDEHIRSASADLYPSTIQSPVGDVWKTYTFPSGASLMINARRIHKYGNYYLIDVYVANPTSTAIKVDFGKMKVHTDTGKELIVYSEDGYLRRVKNRQSWKTAGIASAAWLVSVIADQIFNGSYFEDVDNRTFGGDVMHEIGSVALGTVPVIATMAADQYYSAEFDKIVNNDIGYLRDYKLAPWSSVQGYALARRSSKAKTITITMTVGGKTMDFVWAD